MLKLEQQCNTQPLEKSKTNSETTERNKAEPTNDNSKHHQILETKRDTTQTITKDQIHTGEQRTQSQTIPIKVHNNAADKSRRTLSRQNE